MRKRTTHTIKIEFSDEPVTSFGGLVLADRMAERLGVWRTLAGALPERSGRYDWLTCVKSVALGLLSGSHGTWAAQSVREDSALLALVGLDGAPEEATVWRSLEEVGRYQAEGLMAMVQAVTARRVLERMDRSRLLVEGFAPVFPDGTLLEGSARREGTKFIPEKGEGLLLSTLFVGPVLAAQRLAGPGEGEESCVRAMLSEVVERVLKPLRLVKRALLLVDSLHGDDPTLTQAESLKLHYVAGANKLERTESTLIERPEWEWEATGPHEALGWSDSGVCVCWFQCADWEHKRLLVGRRWKREGEMIWNYAGVLTDLTERDVRGMLDRGLSFPRAIWRLYDVKAGMETLLSDGLSDLGLHHPPCQGHRRNAGFYALASLAWLLATAVDAIGGRSSDRGSRARRDGGLRKPRRPPRMRLWRLRRQLFALPARVVRHGREMRVIVLGLSERLRQLFTRYWDNVCRC